MAQKPKLPVNFHVGQRFSSSFLVPVLPRLERAPHRLVSERAWLQLESPTPLTLSSFLLLIPSQAAANEQMHGIWLIASLLNLRTCGVFF